MRNENKPELDICEFSAQIEDPLDDAYDVIFGFVFIFSFAINFGQLVIAFNSKCRK